MAGCVFLGCSASDNKFSGLSSTVPPLIHSETTPSKKFDDKDYWDTDDFVPYKDDRHDSFDWKLFKVSVVSFLVKID